MRPFALALIAGLLACSSGEAAGSKPVTVKVTIEAMQFSPGDVTVRPGDTVVWTNNDLVAHTVTSKTGVFDSKVIPPGRSWTFVAKRKGDFAYICSLHPMKASLTVR